ncbi:MAG TPA: carbamoyltransferase HypF [Bryobacteraceae bacterium]|nr:carbamoyltransferase HypF [Bryobacteraceae bacterium]
MTAAARSIRIRGVVQGVGFRPFVFRLAHANDLTGWVLNGPDGVDIHVEGAEPDLDAFISELKLQSPPAAEITRIDISHSEPAGANEFSIRESRNGHPSVRISPDLPVCEACRAELFDPADPRYLYPYINCTNCGPRYTIVEGLPYDRSNSTMKAWPLDDFCAAQYHDPVDRRFHAQPVACSTCGPHYFLVSDGTVLTGDAPAIERAASSLCDGNILAIKGIGGYHLACDARNSGAVQALRQRKFRKEKAFAVMVRTVAIARELADISNDAEALLRSIARPIVLVPARIQLPEVAPENHELGLMLPYAPLHHLIFAAGAPDALIMTSANRSSEPIAFDDGDARERLSGIADAFLIGERPIARRVDDSVARVGAFGPMILRRSRGYAPGAVTTLPTARPILALGADLKNSITLVVNGQAFVSQHIGDLDQYESLKSFHETIQDLVSMYQVDWKELLVAYDSHPQYLSTTHALELPARSKSAVQHHRAHIASVLAEKQAWEKRVVGISFDGTGYGDDGTIWGGELFTGSVTEGFQRVLHLKSAVLPGGDAAARYPVQCAAGFLAEMEGIPDLTAAPFYFPSQYRPCADLVRKRVRTFETTSAGRLFDTAAALLGFTRKISFEGQAAMWLEHIAQSAGPCEPHPFPIIEGELDFRPLLEAVIHDRLRGRACCEIARAFHAGIAHGLWTAARQLSEQNATDTVVLSGGVFQNELLLTEIQSRLARGPLQVWMNAAVPPNDGGISLGQAAIAAFHKADEPHA